MEANEVVSRAAARDLGLMFYFTGKPCVNGHVSKRYIDGGCAECIRSRAATRPEEYTRKYARTVTGTARCLLSGTKTRARKKSLDFDLTHEWVLDKLVAGVCEVSGLPFNSDDLGHGVKNPWRPSIDRIDNSRGYTKDNSQMVVAVYNYAKNEFADDDVMTLAIALVASRLH